MKKDEIAIRLNKVKQEYRKWKKEQPRDAEDVDDDGLRKWCYIFPIVLIIASIILLLITMGRL